ncbi:MAG: hypothetical protein HY820_01145 [Acidobacteria bacterium]|nr:hypothetical protein [Acidobacteriota bacterium]
MQVLQAGSHKLLLLELDTDHVTALANQAGFQARLNDGKRVLSVELSAEDRQAPLLLFDAADPSNLGWFSRCQFYVDAKTGAVLQTPIHIANMRDRSGRPVPNIVKLQITKELPSNFRLPGRQAVSEQVVYTVLHHFLQALVSVGVGICGTGVVRPLTGRLDDPAGRN